MKPLQTNCGSRVSRAEVLSQLRIHWLEGPFPAGLPYTQVSGFCFTDAGKLLLIRDQGEYGIPGGKPETGETHVQTLIREVMEEAQCELEKFTFVGYRRIEGDPNWLEGRPHAQVRYACWIRAVGPQVVDIATERMFERSFWTPRAAVRCLNWGDEGVQQVSSACRALGVPWI